MHKETGRIMEGLSQTSMNAKYNDSAITDLILANELIWNRSWYLMWYILYHWKSRMQAGSTIDATLIHHYWYILRAGYTLQVCQTIPEASIGNTRNAYILNCVQRLNSLVKRRSVTPYRECTTHALVNINI